MESIRFTFNANILGFQSIDEIVAQLLAYPMGKAWERFMPTRVFRTFGYEWSLNPGAFTHKG